MHPLHGKIAEQQWRIDNSELMGTNGSLLEEELQQLGAALMDEHDCLDWELEIAVKDIRKLISRLKMEQKGERQKPHPEEAGSNESIEPYQLSS